MSDDLISRSALKEAVKGNGTVLTVAHINYLIDNAPTVEIPVARWDAYCEGQKVGYEKGIEERPKGKWIPVSVQEPDVGGMYLVTAKGVNGYIGIDIARRVSDNVWTFGGEELSGVEIIAWQLLPKPYKEAENEKDN